ncbi:thyroid transcription factor 1-associated protein 26 homolog isoform X2 [Odontomachus brunneus]|uniref:thyroid transcription factor 1-associated protein 26 homolog isoform X2 n=1 Tax=Odontomachus brunneus TaxID=486640 RepID=UPI0013F23E98|nr:thyroid transcription factor 1-associated protein 26 homolog isoform X2 [Odontomachus brunneus]
MRNNMKNIENKARRKQGDDKKKQHEKTFDKKKYRLKKYSNKYKINQWEERRRKAVMREFHKELKRNQQDSTQTLTDLSDTSKDTDTSNSEKKNYAFFKAKQAHKCIMKDKKEKMEEINRKKEESNEALKKYKEKKMHTFRALSKKTKKGQPVMKGRIELLLEKIQENLT